MDLTQSVDDTIRGLKEKRAGGSRELLDVMLIYWTAIANDETKSIEAPEAQRRDYHEALKRTRRGPSDQRKLAEDELISAIRALASACKARNPL